MSTAIELDGLTKRFGERTAVDRLTFTLPEGGVTGFLGPNGSGKSTTIRMLLGLVRPSAGSARILGAPAGAAGPDAPRIGALVDSPALYPAASALDNLRVHAALAGLPSSRIAPVLERVGLAGREHGRVRSFSLGMRQRLAIAVALLADPRVLILDEPTNGLDPEGIVEIRELLRALGAEGRTVLVSSHVLAEMQAACDRFVVIRDGRLLFAGSSTDLLAAAPSRVIARPERPDQLTRLGDLLAARGIAARHEHDELVLDLESERSPEVNRIAFDAGITLRELVTRPGDLEDVFIHLTRREAAA